MSLTFYLKYPVIHKTPKNLYIPLVVNRIEIRRVKLKDLIGINPSDQNGFIKLASKVTGCKEDLLLELDAVDWNSVSQLINQNIDEINKVRN
jgi:hypothetical protein